MLENIIVRPARESDLDDLYEMSGIAQAGLTNFPHDRNVLSEFLEESSSSFSNPSKGNPYFLFVMECISEKKVIGVSGIISKVGVPSPNYRYRVESYHTHSPRFKDYLTYQSLHLEPFELGLSEVCSLYLKPEYRRHNVGRLLSLHRFLFMALFPQYFEETVMAEMRGLSNKEGVSPFYSALWEDRLKMSFVEANRMILDYPEMMWDMRHKYPIELSLLPHWVRDVVAQPHPKTAPAYGLLASVGFEYKGSICCMDAGPVLMAKRDCISTVSLTRTTRDWVIMPDLELELMKQSCLGLVSNGKCLEYRCGIGVKVHDKIVLSSQLASSLDVFPGDEISVSPFYPSLAEVNCLDLKQRQDG